MQIKSSSKMAEDMQTRGVHDHNYLYLQFFMNE
jgi:hypothetical protein